MDLSKINMTGSWSVDLFTPFGVSNLTLLITSLNPDICGSVFDENGSLNFNNGNFLDNKLFFSAVAETPIQATVRFDFTFNSENSFSGKIMIDEYATIDAKGKRNVNL
jgi:hypothetical protein